MLIMLHFLYSMYFICNVSVANGGKVNISDLNKREKNGSTLVFFKKRRYICSDLNANLLSFIS